MSEFIKVNVFVIGTKKRARKNERHLFEVEKDIPFAEDLDLSKYAEKAKEVVKKEMKIVAKTAQLKTTVYTIKKEGSFETMSALLFDSRNKELEIELC